LGDDENCRPSCLVFRVSCTYAYCALRGVVEGERSSRHSRIAHRTIACVSPLLHSHAARGGFLFLFFIFYFFLKRVEFQTETPPPLYHTYHPFLFAGWVSDGERAVIGRNVSPPPQIDFRFNFQIQISRYGSGDGPCIAVLIDRLGSCGAKKIIDIY